MSQAGTPIASSVVAVYPDQATAKRAVRQLHDAGVALGDLSIVARNFQETDQPYGFVSRGDYAGAGAETGAWFGGMFGLFIGAGILILPGLGLVVVAGPIAAALLAGIEGAVAGTAWAAWRARSSAGVFRRTGRSNTRRRSREASFSSSSGQIRRSSPAPGACSPPPGQTTSMFTSRRRLQS